MALYLMNATLMALRLVSISLDNEPFVVDPESCEIQTLVIYELTGPAICASVSILLPIEVLRFLLILEFNRNAPAED